jgi:hypothetical protein
MNDEAEQKQGDETAKQTVIDPPTMSTASKQGFLIDDPSAGSPTDTLLRLLLPLNDEVQSTSQGEPEGSPYSEDFAWPFDR